MSLLAPADLIIDGDFNIGLIRMILVPKNDHFAIIVPTLNADSDWPRVSRAILSQQLARQQVLIVDSASTDGTAELARHEGFRVVEIARSEFNHGGTRQWAAQFFPNAEILIYMTQDAILASPNAIQQLLRAFDNPLVGAAFGRQLPAPKAGPIEAHARLFNYPARSSIRSLESREKLGFKSIFISNSFAAYRRTALGSVGGFPSNMIFGEDTITAAKLLLAGWKIAYVAEAQVHHSHSYTCRQDFKRYFDIGVLHTRAPWLLEEFGQTGSEGRRFVLSEIAYVCHRSPWLLPSALLRTVLKLIGYKLGKMEDRLSLSWKRRFSMHSHFWQEDHAGEP